jgi:hypothetical protein
MHAIPAHPASKTLTPGSVAELAGETLVLKVPGTDYRLHLQLASGQPRPGIGERVDVKITLRARRVDLVGAGGRYIEPNYGRPRRIQGRVLATDAATHTLVVAAGPVVHATLTDARQNADDFPVGAMVSFDAEPGAVGELVEV